MLSYIFSITALACLVVQEDANDLATLHRKREKYLLAEFERPGIWRDQNQKQKLLALLAEAKALRSPLVAAKIVNHIDYDIVGNLIAPPRLTVEERFPVYAVLYETGVRGVPILLERVRALDKGNRVRDLSLMCFVYIYEEGGFGKELARKRIELESEKCKGKERDRLIEAVKGFPFR